MQGSAALDGSSRALTRGITGKTRSAPGRLPRDPIRANPQLLGEYTSEGTFASAKVPSLVAMIDRTLGESAHSVLSAGTTGR